VFVRNTGAVSPHGFVSITFLIGVLFAVMGGGIRIACYRTLGAHFTYDLTIRDKHKLVTTGPYAIVRHPSYVGVELLLLGVTLSEFTPGSWWFEAGLYSRPLGIGIAVIWSSILCFLSTLLLRAPTEDEMLRGAFGEEWEAYARRVPFWYIPGII
jgi:protein-S-isoprenylcysteine O-methyltransferase Ste14